MAAWIAAVCTASLLPALVFAVLAFDGRIAASHATGNAFAVAWVVAGLHVLLLGVPITLALRACGRFGLGWMIGAGFIAGLLPCAAYLLLQTLAAQAPWSGLVNAVVALIVLCAGGFGLLAAFGLWAVLRVALPLPIRRR